MKRSFLVPPLTLLLTLIVMPTLAQAAATAAPVPSKTISHLALRAAETEDDEEFEGEGEGAEECEATEGIFEFEEEESEEDEEFEVEECEEETAKRNGAAVTAPEECRVRSAESSIATLPSSNRVQLTVRYLTYKPATVSLDLRLKDGKGSLKIDDATKHLGKKGVLRLTTKVTDAVMERATKATEFDVALRAAKTPGYCGTMLEQQLKAKHPVGNARVYTQRVD
ncbi:MAG TPA: hypothetical protein VN522_07530 [Solirubrobacterales bacterium]|nr:hypothetical protein [Solirubrobacterales bacterium]